MRRFGLGGRRRILLAAALSGLVVSTLLGGCSSNPFDEMFGSKPKSDEKKKKAAEAKKAEPAGPQVQKVKKGERPYPNLASVPKRPKGSTPQQRLVIEEGLMADRARARHTEVTPPWAQPKTGNRRAGAAPAAGPVKTVTVAGARLATIRFPTGSARLPAGAGGLMRQIAALQKRTNGIVVAVGHTSTRKRNADPARDKKAKEALSLARANAVLALLTRAGVRKNRLQGIGRGDAEPVDPRRVFLNRRVEIFLRR